jgi:hypothetical protein
MRDGIKNEKQDLGIAGALSISFLFAGSAHADADFRLANTTGYTISSVYSSVYVSPGFDPSRGADRLGSYVLQTGQSFMVRQAKDADFYQDLLVTFTNSQRTAEWREINLCGLSRITVGYDSDTRILFMTRQ